MREEVYSDYLDNLLVTDIEKIVAQGYYVIPSNGHILAILPEGSELDYGRNN